MSDEESLAEAMKASATIVAAALQTFVETVQEIALSVSRYMEHITALWESLPADVRKKLERRARHRRRYERMMARRKRDCHAPFGRSQ